MIDNEDDIIFQDVDDEINALLEPRKSHMQTLFDKVKPVAKAKKAAFTTGALLIVFLVIALLGIVVTSLNTDHDFEMTIAAICVGSLGVVGCASMLQVFWNDQRRAFRELNKALDRSEQAPADAIWLSNLHPEIKKIFKQAEQEQRYEAALAAN